jgi:hypothetical protein
MLGYDVLVYEKSPYWSIGLRRLYETQCGAQESQAPRIGERRILAEVLREAAKDFTGVLLLELTHGNAERLLDGAVRLERENPDAKKVVVARGELAAWEPAARTAGAVYFASSLAELGPVVELIARRPRRPRSLDRLTQIWDELPWAETRSPHRIQKAH